MCPCEVSPYNVKAFSVTLHRFPPTFELVLESFGWQWVAVGASLTRLDAVLLASLTFILLFGVIQPSSDPYPLPFACSAECVLNGHNSN